MRDIQIFRLKTFLRKSEYPVTPEVLYVQVAKQPIYFVKMKKLLHLIGIRTQPCPKLNFWTHQPS